jgi:hypothetical protein
VPGPSWTDITTFAAIESGLGRRITWWITSSTHVIALNWQGPHKHDYHAFLVDEPDWANQLREHSDKENDHG